MVRSRWCPPAPGRSTRYCTVWRCTRCQTASDSACGGRRRTSDASGSIRASRFSTRCAARLWRRAGGMPHREQCSSIRAPSLPTCFTWVRYVWRRKPGVRILQHETRLCANCWFSGKTKTEECPRLRWRRSRSCKAPRTSRPGPCPLWGGPQRFAWTQLRISKRKQFGWPVSGRAILEAELPQRREQVGINFNLRAAELAARRRALSKDPRVNPDDKEEVVRRQRALGEQRRLALEELNTTPNRIVPGAVRFLAHAVVQPADR